MADIEKVIKAIECCVVNHTRCFDDNDKLCPYFSTKVYMCEIELLKDALSLLKEQEKKIGEWIYKHDNLWYCSRCGEIIYSETDDDLEIHHAYCSRCGANMKQEGR